MITFEITICEKCDRFCFCDYCNLPDYDDRRVASIENIKSGIRVLQPILQILDKNNIEYQTILGGIGEPGLVDESIISYLFNNIYITGISTTGAFLEKYHRYASQKPIYLHIAIPDDEYLISKYRNITKKVWTIFSSIEDMDCYTYDLYDKIYLEGNPKTQSFEYKLLDTNLPNVEKIDLSILELNRKICRTYTPGIVINLTRGIINMCSCYNSSISMPLTTESLISVLTESPFAKHDDYCFYCYRNCYGLSNILNNLLFQRLTLKRIFNKCSS